jgi:chromosome partitioning protein
MEVLAIANHKGGVAKTTTSVNLAAALAHADRPTLLVDADPQSHATLWFADDLADVEADLQDVIVDHVPPSKVILPTRIPGLDILPATLSLARLDVDLVSLPRREDRVKRALAPVADRYAYAVVDLAPALSLVTLAALAAATRIIIPVSATRLAVGALGTFLGWLDEFRDEEVITAPLLGVLVTMFDGRASYPPTGPPVYEARTRVAREVLTALHSSQDAAAELSVFETVIPRRTAVEDQVAERLVVGDAGMSAPVAEAYERFAGEVMARIEGQPERRS